MAFHEANYDVYVALGDPALEPLWTWDVWEEFSPALDPLIEAANGRAAVRSNQQLPERGGPVNYGKLSWTADDHEMWVHNSPNNADDSIDWTFTNTEVWAPSWTVCEQLDQGPDVYFSLSNELQGRALRYTPAFNPLVILAVETKLAAKKKTLVKKALKAIQTALQPKLFATTSRPWGYATDDGGFTDALNDLSMDGLFKAEKNPHAGKLGLEVLKGKWKSVE